MTEKEPDWLNTDEAARRLGITTRTLYRFMDQGDLPAYRMGRVFRLKVADVEAFIENCRVQPGTLGHLYPVAKTDESGDRDDAVDGADADQAGQQAAASLATDGHSPG